MATYLRSSMIIEDRPAMRWPTSLTFDSEERLGIFSRLPDELYMQILARVPRGCYYNLRMVCKTWNNAPWDDIFKLREKLGLKEEWVYILLKDEEEELHWYALDPISCKWYSLPRMPDVIQKEGSKSNQIGAGWDLFKALRDCFSCKDPLDRSLLCSSAIGSLNGYMYVLGGSFGEGAMSCVWRYDPRKNEWEEVASMTFARAYCRTASLNDKLYAVGGVIRGRGYFTTLQSAEAYDPIRDTWTQISGIPVGKLQLGDGQAIATGMETFGGKLCVHQSLYLGSAVVNMHGQMYDPDAACWMDMPNHMGAGWPVMPSSMGDGWPATQSGTKLSVVMNGNLYALDPSSSLDSGEIKMYDPQEDAWNVVLRKVPVLDFTDSESPCLFTGFMGKLYVITKDNRGDVSILQADTSNPGNASLSSSTSPDSSQSDGHGWRTIASKNFGFVELVNCQVVDI